MVVSDSLAAHSSSTIDNVVLFISDSLGFKWLPESVADEGITARAITPSTYTAASIPSIMLGTYPPEHKVWKFSDRIRGTPALFKPMKNCGVNVENVWGADYDDDEKPTLKFLNLTGNTRLRDLDEPFVYVVHDHGGHMPYGSALSDFDPAEEFWRDHSDREDVIVDRYRDGVEGSAERFFEIIDRLRGRGILESTLVVFTSDHGELVGEYAGLYGHGNPIVPELVEVPVVFMGAELPGDESYEHLLSSIDIAPTVLDALDRPIPTEIRGTSVWETPPSPDRAIESHTWKPTRFGRMIEYKAMARWGDSGGVVHHFGPAFQRILFALGFHLHRSATSPVIWEQALTRILSILRLYAPKKRCYGNPSDELRHVDRERVSFERQAVDRDVEINEEQLRDLGYFEE